MLARQLVTRQLVARQLVTRQLALALLAPVALLVLVVFGAARPVAAQAGMPLPTLPDNARIHGAGDVTWSLLAAAPFESTYKRVQIRRFLDEQGRLIEIREHLTVLGDGTEQAPFRLDFVDLITSTGADVPLTNRMRAVYQANAGLIHHHGAFGVRDVAAATANYSLHDLGACLRAGRHARRVLVFPNRLDKGIWVVDLDCITAVPLYSAEYDCQGTLINELEVLAFQSPMATRSQSWGWQPRLQVNRFATIAAAEAALRVHQPGTVALRPRLAAHLGEYVQDLVQVSEDPINGDRSLVIGYTDGIDEVFVVQDFNTIDPLPVTATTTGDSGKTHAIATYDDRSLRVYLFHEGGATYQVMGRSSLERLDDVAKQLCRQVVTGR